MGLPQIALIGVSGYGRVHLQLARDCRDRGEIAIAAATVINSDDEAGTVAELRAHGTRIYADYEAMLRAEAGRIDLCMIPTGIHWHARMTIAALQSGANVLVEKPLAGSLAEAEAVQAAEQASGRFVAVGFQDLYDAGTVWLKSALIEGAIGPIQTVRFLGIWPRPEAYFRRTDWAGKNTVAGIPVFDSPLNNAFAHFVLLSQYFASPTLTDAAVPKLEHVDLRRAHAIDNFDTATIVARTPEGVRLWFGVSHACDQPIEPEIVIQGRDGTAWWRYENEACLVNTNGGQQRRALPPTTATRGEMLAAVLRRLRDANAPICSTGLAARHCAMIADIQRHGTVRDFPAEAVTWTATATGRVPNVRGLRRALIQAFDAQTTLDAVGLAAAAAP